MRATVVHGMLLTTVTSLAVSVVEQWTSMPWCLRLRAPRHGHVDLGPAGWPELVKRRGGAVREDRAGTAREHGRHPEPLALEQIPWHQGVDGVVLPVESAGGRPSFGTAGCTQTAGVDLIQSKHAVLLAGESR